MLKFIRSFVRVVLFSVGAYLGFTSVVFPLFVAKRAVMFFDGIREVWRRD
mgnify:CR=1 FL=1